MNSLSAIAYVSSALGDVSEARLEALLVDSRGFNLSKGVTGVLLYHDGKFFQYIEGPVSGVEEVYARIKASRRHFGLVELLHERIHGRVFSEWSMGFACAPRNFILQLERQRWSDVSAQLTSGAEVSAGLDFLLQFWKGSTRGMS